VTNQISTSNLLTFDIEGFIESSYESMRVPAEYISERLEAEEIEANTASILDLLEEFGQKATFFVLGRIARDMPHLVRRIADAGHEIGCHSLFHRRLYNFQRNEVAAFLEEAKSRLEDASGGPVYGFRAPDFSITRSNLWAFDLLREKSFLYDSSIYPTGLHDVYGISDFPTIPFRFPNGLIEVPLSTVRIFSRNIPYGGGGYFRLYPLAVTEALFRGSNRKGVAAVVYLHPYEVGNMVRKIRGIGIFKSFRTYVGQKKTAAKLRALLGAFSFARVIDYLGQKRIDEILV
jgi:polysaccharide deacetylase family protein (PEP-CTERM system associated)